MLNFAIEPQPNDSTCGPTCLHSLYQYYGDKISLKSIIEEVERVQNGGTLAPLLGSHALKRGYECEIYVYNVRLFDPSWFHPISLPPDELLQKLQLQHPYLQSPALIECSLAHQNFLESGGIIHFKDLTRTLLKRYFSLKIPILTGLSATYLYRSARDIELPDGRLVRDDIRGTPTGHFVILYGYQDSKTEVIVADPLKENPLSHDNYYVVKLQHLINAIMLGVLSYDANMLMIYPKGIKP